MLLKNITHIAVFCGSNIGKSPLYRETAIALAQVLCDQGITLVYGGAKVGLMGVMADYMLKNSGKVIGIIPQSLVDVEIAHENLTDLYIVNSMHERKAQIVKLASGFILLPGGAGSLDEFFEVFTWAQLGYHSKPCGILNIDNYYDHLLKLLDHATAEGFLKNVHREMIITEQAPLSLIQKFKNYQPPADKKWIKPPSSL